MRRYEILQSQIINRFQGSRSTAVLQFLEKVLKLKNKSLELPKLKMNVQTLHKRKQKYSPPKDKKDRATALEKLFFIAGGADWDSQFQKKKKPAMEEVKRVASFICPEASVDPQIIEVTTCAQEFSHFSPDCLDNLKID